MRLDKVLYLMSFGMLILMGCRHRLTDTLNIATAANMQFAMVELVASFEHRTKIQCEVILGSSGKLTTQIMEGAPYDLFVSANPMYAEKLYAKGMTTAVPLVYAYGRLILWSTSDDGDIGLEQLASDKISHIAIANPKIAPYGQASMEVLSQIETIDQIATKIVYGESISQVNQFILSGAADVGFTTKSVVLSPQMSGNGKWIDIDTSLYAPIAQSVVIIKNKNGQQSSAEKFKDFLLSEVGRGILVKYGYGLGSVLYLQK